MVMAMSETGSPYLTGNRERVHAIVQIGYDEGDDPEVPTFTVASSNVTSTLAGEVFDDACQHFGIDEDGVQAAQDALADHVFPVGDPQYRTTLALGAVTVEEFDFEVDWRTLSWVAADSKRGETA